MNIRKLYLVIVALLVVPLVLSACTVPMPAAPIQAPAESAAPPADATTSTFGTAWQSVSCDTFNLNKDIAEASDCGYVTVPENRLAGNDKTIKLAVVRVRSSSAQPGTPVIEGTGGPGGPGLGGAQIILQESAGILADRDWVFFSQRGTAFVRPELSCEAYNGVQMEAARNGWPVDNELATMAEAVQACVDEYRAQGIDLNAYNSVENAEDVNAVRQALGFDKIIYYGQSYGTLLGQFVMRTHPEILEAVILDGIAPANAKRWTDVTDYPAAFRNVFEACAKDETCHATYPDPEGTLAGFLERLKTDPQTIEIEAGGEKLSLSVSDSLVMNTLFTALYVNGGMLPLIIHQLDRGDMGVFNLLVRLGFASTGDTARVQHLAMVCSDDPVNTLEEAHLDRLPEMYRGLASYDAVGYVDGCGIMKAPQLPDSSDELVQSDIPTLMLQGGLDPATQVKSGNLVQPGLKNSYNVIVPAGSHIVMHSACIQSIMAAFMRDPLSAPDTGCVDPKIPFEIPTMLMQAAGVAATPAPEPASTAAKFGPAWKPVSCDTFNLDATTAEGSDCGYVTVPVRHDEPDGPTIQLGVVRIRSTGEEPASDPLVMEQGGPGGSTIGFFPNQTRRLVEILNQRDIVLVEQRGTQYSIPWLDCSSARNAHNIAVAKGEAEDDGSYLNGCKADWDEQGIDLSAFNDTENAADIYAAVAALGYDQFNYYGLSYGTELGQHVMKAAADHPDVLRSVILDSVVPIDIQDQPLKDMIVSQSLRTLFENCAQDAACSQDFPDLEQKTLALLEQMNVTPVVVTATLPSGEKLPMPVTGSDLFVLLFENLYSRQTIRQLPGILDTMIQKGDFSWVAKQKTAGLALTPGGMAEGMHLSMWCPRLGKAPFLGTDLFAPAYPQANIVELAVPDYARRCQIMDVASAEAADFVYPDADIPTLILSGAMDPATPPQYAALVAGELKTAYAYTLPDAAHNVMLDSPTNCALNMAVAFLADPSQTPDSTCVKDLKPVFARRVTPLDEMTFEPRTVITGVTASVPTSFTDPQGTGLYSDPADPINVPTGLVRFAVVAADTVDAALASLKDSTVIAEDQAIGNYRWKVVESRTMMKGIIARGAATALPDGEHYLTIMLGGPENSADAIFATLLEPILSSIKAE